MSRLAFDFSFVDDFDVASFAFYDSIRQRDAAAYCARCLLCAAAAHAMRNRLLLRPPPPPPDALRGFLRHFRFAARQQAQRDIGAMRVAALYAILPPARRDSEGYGALVLSPGIGR